MNSHHLHWYIDEILIHSMGANDEILRMRELIADPSMWQSRLVWSHLISFLSNAAMISKYVDPINPNEIAVERMKCLRAALAITEHSHLLPRSARDNIEHFDERIDSWVERGSDTVLELVVPDRAGFDYIARPENAIKRVIVADELIFVSEKRNGQRLELQLAPIIEAIADVREKAGNWIAQNSPYSFVYPSR